MNELNTDPSLTQLKTQHGEGTRGIERVVRLLRVLTLRPNAGWTLSALAETAGLKKTTAHRMLKKLEAEGLVHRRAVDQRYVFGAFMLESSFSVTGFHPFIAACHAALDKLANHTGAAALLSFRSGPDFVVALRIGKIKGSGVLAECGARRPLISATPGMAILLGLPEQLQNDIMQHSLEAMPIRSTRESDEIKRRWHRSRELGYAASYGETVPRVNTLAVPLRLPGGQAFASITLVNIPGRFDNARVDQIVGLLGKESTKIMNDADSYHFLEIYQEEAC